jgi:type IV pilus assembly protein PilA
MHHQNRTQNGFSLIELLMVITLIGIISAIATPNLLASKRAANEASAITSLRTIVSAQASYLQSFGSGNSYASDLTVLRSKNLIEERLSYNAEPTKSGYIFRMEGVGATFTCTASPISPGSTGTKYFFVDNSGVIRFDNSGTADAMSRPID